ncbi:MAG: ribosome maturation factor [Chitinophagaceae bacterium]
MTVEQQIERLEELTNAVLANQADLFLVNIKIKPTNNVKLFVDADNGITIETLTQLNRTLYKQIEESGLFPSGDFSLEVSSPGLDEPLKLNRQYKKNIGRYVETILKDGGKKEGKLVDVTDDGFVIEIETGKGKKKETKTESLLFDQIKSTKIQIKF